MLFLSLHILSLVEYSEGTEEHVIEGSSYIVPAFPVINIVLEGHGGIDLTAMVSTILFVVVVVSII